EMGDRYMRRLGTPHLNDPLASRDYFRDILPKTMAKNKATRPDEILALKEYQDKFVKISKLLSAVRSSKDKHVLEIAAKFTDPGELDPRKLFSPEKAQLGIKIMHESLVKISKKYGDAYARQLMGNPMSYLVAYGLVLNYEKYRMENNYGFRYFAAAAKDAVMGLNIEATYNILPEYNEKKDGERYNPKDPKKGETC
ncbi:hypothetical protein KKA47_06415, partial [bacterium]|nr:hypothetical protein [bacterium]